MLCTGFWIVSLLVLPSWGRLADDISYSSFNNNCVTEQCFHQPVEACPSPDNKCRCRRLPHCERAAVCCNVNKFQLTEGLACANISTNGYVEALHIRNATLDILNVTQAAWRRLRYMTITDGQINSVVGEFAKHTVVSCLNLSSNGIVHFENRSLVHLYNLSFLDLSNNNLSDVPRFKKEGHVALDISGNKRMDCTNIFESFKRTVELDFRNRNSTFCYKNNNFKWFNSTDFVPLQQLIEVQEITKVCPHMCKCAVSRMDFMPGQPPDWKISVTCSGLGLTSLPTPLPPSTSFLNVENNNITSLEMLNTDPTYHNLRELIADNNQITSVMPLEGSKFLSHFSALTLRNNKLKSIPTYVFSNVFDRVNLNYRTIVIKLGLNRLQCDCNTAKVLKIWLLSKQRHITDYEEIYCDNMDSKVVDLIPSKMCQTQQEWTDYVYYIIAGEVFLLVGLVLKVCYDYYVFKHSGYLPWPASKMPKLPCDWLCE